MAWRGNPENPVPNVVNETSARSEERVDVNRSDQVRRDTDTQKDFGIRLIDIDNAIMTHLESLNLSVVDEGNNIKIPFFYANPEKWKSIKTDGIIRDYNGKMILPAMVFQRTSAEKDQSLLSFNRYLRYTVMKKYSTKNKYTPFNVLIGKNVPINEIYDVVIPDHMIFTYHFIIWTEYREQLNRITERINFETEDYWGDPKRFKFRTKIDSFSDITEVQSDDDRIVKTEFDMMVYGYLLPDIFKNSTGTHSTVQKHLTPKKLIMGEKIVSTSEVLNSEEVENRKKFVNQNYPNLQKDEEIPPPPIVPDPDKDIK